MKFEEIECVSKKGSKICRVITKYRGKDIFGVAKCHPDDDYDRDFGMKLARFRCEEKLLKAQRKRFKELIKNSEEAIRLWSKDLEVYNNKIKKINELINEVNIEVTYCRYFGNGGKK